MKLATNIAGGLLGLLFIAFSMMFFLKMMPDGPKPPEGSLILMFMGALAPSGYLTFVKACELIGGILVAIPRTRNWGLLILGPIIINILAFHVFIAKGSLFDPAGIIIISAIVVLALFLMWSGRKAFLGLLNRPA